MNFKKRSVDGQVIKEIVVHTFTLTIFVKRNIFKTIVSKIQKLVCAVIKLESLIMAQNVRWRHA